MGGEGEGEGVGGEECWISCCFLVVEKVYRFISSGSESNNKPEPSVHGRDARGLPAGEYKD